MKTETKTGVRCPNAKNAKDSGKPPEARKKQGRILSRTFRESMALAAP